MEGTLNGTEGDMVPLVQGKFIRIHFGPTGKLASADIDSCESGRGQGRCGKRDRGWAKQVLWLLSALVTFLSISDQFSLESTLPILLAPGL